MPEALPPLFDLIYLDKNGERTMSVVILVDGESRTVGPFPALGAAPKIVDALLAEPALGFADRADAISSYAFAHFRNMQQGENYAGQSYPWRLRF